MKTEIQITFENDYIKIIANGEKDFDIVKKIWSRAVETCVTNDCYKILGISNSTKAVSITDGYKHSELFRELGINYKYRIAWVELNSKMIENTQFIETVLQNRGLPGKLFKNIEDAKNWLLNDF
ncbi:MAG: hypothetical protein GQ527_06185 [Bacteroidales bacterium]|nr:hypothetical protein [Bacteroidales bacterium]